MFHAKYDLTSAGEGQPDMVAKNVTQACGRVRHDQFTPRTTRRESRQTTSIWACARAIDNACRRPAVLTAQREYSDDLDPESKPPTTVYPNSGPFRDTGPR